MADGISSCDPTRGTLRLVHPLPERLMLFFRERLARCVATDAPLRLILFGSRARGDNRPRSDFDLSLDAPTMLDAEWVRLALDVDEEAPTLCGIDLVHLQKAQPALRQAILDEGVIIYERNTKNQS